MSDERGYTHSIALRDIRDPDYCDVVIVSTRGVKENDARVWARALFAPENASLTQRSLRALRDEFYRKLDLGLKSGGAMLSPTSTADEALVVETDAHRQVHIGIKLDQEAQLLTVTTAVKFRTLRGRVTFMPQKLVHAANLHTLAKRAPVTLKRQQKIATAKLLTQKTEGKARQVIGQARQIAGKTKAKFQPTQIESAEIGTKDRHPEFESRKPDLKQQDSTNDKETGQD